MFFRLFRWWNRCYYSWFFCFNGVDNWNCWRVRPLCFVEKKNGYAITNWLIIVNWTPQRKQYSNMSTKVRAKKAKIFMQAELDNNKKLQFYIIEQMVLKKKNQKRILTKKITYFVYNICSLSLAIRNRLYFSFS